MHWYQLVSGWCVEGEGGWVAEIALTYEHWCGGVGGVLTHLSLLSIKVLLSSIVARKVIHTTQNCGWESDAKLI